MHHHTPLYTALHHHTPLYITGHPHTYPYNTIQHHTPLNITIHPYTSPYIPMHHHTSLYITIHPYTSPYTPFTSPYTKCFFFFQIGSCTLICSIALTAGGFKNKSYSTASNYGNQRFDLLHYWKGSWFQQGSIFVQILMN